MKLELGYGSTFQTVEIPERNLIGILTPNPIERTFTGEAEVLRALREPIGTACLRDIVRPGEKIAIVTSDITRPMPTRKVLPAILEELGSAGVRDGDITLVFALGSHRPQTKEECRAAAGDEAFRRIRCINSDPSDFVHLGTTTRGTPVDITRVVAEADRRVLLGNIEYHYFAGYSGGAKALMPGVSTREAIRANHSLMTESTSCAGNLSGNNLRADIEEAETFCRADFILNVVLDEHKEIIKAVAGDVTLAHREGCRFLDTLYSKQIERRADIVVVSQGGAPKDMNLYQTQKALDNAKYAVRKGGTIILIGACSEGLGESTFARWMREAPSADSLIERVRTDFQLGGHKAAAIAMVLRDARVYLVSELPDETVRSCFLTPAHSAQAALESALGELGPDATVLVMPYGGSTLPRCLVP